MDYLNGIDIANLFASLNEAKTIAWQSQKINVNVDMNKHYIRLSRHCRAIKNLTRNTIYAPILIDCHALVEALNNYGNPIDKAVMDPIYDNDSKYNEIGEISVPSGYQMRIWYSRYTCNGDGFHVGYESVVFIADCIKKSSLNLHGGMPNALSSYVVCPDSFEIDSMNLPDEEFPTKESHDPDCAIHNELPVDHDWELTPFPDECTCYLNDNWGGYTHPDNDFFYNEIDSIIKYIIQEGNLPEAEYDSDNNEWNIGNEVSWKVGDISSDDYPKS